MEEGAQQRGVLCQSRWGCGFVHTETRVQDTSSLPQPRLSTLCWRHSVHCEACSAKLGAPVQAVASAGSVEELRTLLAELELSVHAEYISPHFRHVPPAVPGAWLPPAAAPLPEAAQEGSAAAVKAEPSEAAQRLAWMPATAASRQPAPGRVRRCCRLRAGHAARPRHAAGLPAKQLLLRVSMPCSWNLSFLTTVLLVCILQYAAAHAP